jgi:hypothetical protein
VIRFGQINKFIQQTIELIGWEKVELEQFFKQSASQALLVW